MGTFSVDEAQTLEQAEQDWAIVSMDDLVRRCFPTLRVTDTQTTYVRNGHPLTGMILPAALTAMLSESGRFLALYRQEGSDAVVPAEADALAEAVFT